jgi:hypothetical protein
MVGKQRKPEITRMSQLQDELRHAQVDKLKVFESANSRDVEAYLRQNSQMIHDVVILSSRRSA